MASGFPYSTCQSAVFANKSEGVAFLYFEQMGSKSSKTLYLGDFLKKTLANSVSKFLKNADMTVFVETHWQ